MHLMLLAAWQCAAWAAGGLLMLLRSAVRQPATAVRRRARIASRVHARAWTAACWRSPVWTADRGAWVNPRAVTPAAMVLAALSRLQSSSCETECNFVCNCMYISMSY